MNRAAPALRDGAAQTAGPIFLAGADRSGKTLVRWMLSSLPGIAVTRRTEMWTQFYGRFGSLARPDNLDRCLTAMLERKHIAALVADAAALRRDFGGGPATYARLFALVQQQHAERSGKSRWLDQSGLVERFAGEVLAAYPDAKVIHMIRDPRDCYHAMLARSGAGGGALGALLDRWTLSARLALANERRHPDRYTVIRYESLVGHPEQTMRALCSFLDEGYRPSMLLLENARRYDGESRAAGGGSPISAAYVGSFRGALRQSDIMLIQRAAGRYMRAFGYESDPVDLPFAALARAAVTVWPPSVARFARDRAARATKSWRRAR